MSRPPRSVAFDVGLSVFMAAVAGLSLYIASDPALAGPAADYPRALGTAAILVVNLGIAARRRFPVTTLAVVAVAYLPMLLGEVPEAQVSSVSLFIAMYTAGAYGERHRDLARGVVAASVAGGVAWAVFRTPPVPYEGNVPIEVINVLLTVSNAVYVVAAWMLGDLVRNRRLREARLEAQSAALAGAQVDLARRAVLAERVRIARELHDVVAHHVSVIGVQAGAARRVMGTQPDAAAELLGSIEASSRDTVAELQSLLGLLRQEGDDDGTDPRPRLDRLPVLVEQMQEAGLEVHLDLDRVDELPAGVELSAYRIVQEALTNALKHGGPGAKAEVAVRRRPASLELTVANDGRTPVTRNGKGGHGLLG
ncbi:MAG: histidine kinase, partial [Actinomycetota bacterium]|nr:histidine kinase [Actinomycetota bacterium]